MMRGEERKTLFKRQDLETGRRRREETTTQLRKTKKEEQLMKRRQAPQPTEKDNNNNNGDKNKSSYTVNDVPKLMAIIAMPNQIESEMLTAVKGIRRMLSVEVNPPVNEVIDAGALPYLVQLLHQSNVDLIFEAAWALTNIASTNRTRAVVEQNQATDCLIRLLTHSEAHIREQAAWCLGNIAGDCHELRDHVLSKGALGGLILNLNDPASQSLLSNVTWAVSNMCRGKPSPSEELIGPAIGPLAGLLHRNNISDDVLVDAVWALSYLADGDNGRIQAVMDTNITGILINLIAQNKQGLMTPVVRTLGNFVTGNDSQTQATIDAGIIVQASMLLHNSNRTLRKETCWLLSNIAAGTKEQIEYLFKENGLLEKVSELARQDRWEVRKEAIWVVSNIFTTGSEFHVRSLVQRNGLQAVVEALDCKDPRILTVAMEAVEKVLLVGEKYTLGYDTLMDEYNGIDHLELLQEHPNEEVYEKAVGLLERFFNAECDEEDENLAPSANEDAYSFGLPLSKQLFPADEAADGSTSAQNVLGQNNFDFTMGMQH